MGEMGQFECAAATCEYGSALFFIGVGMKSSRELRRCAVCSELTSVPIAHIDPEGTRDASGRGRCPNCKSQRLHPVADDPKDAKTPPPCPWYGGSLTWQSVGMWD